MPSHEDLDAILKRLEDGTPTATDLAMLRQLLHGDVRPELVQKLAKYNVYLDKAEGGEIQIGDRYYNTPQQETAEVDFRRYLRAIAEEYQQRGEKYTLTDVLGREKRKEKGRSAFEWNFDLIVQTPKKQEPEEEWQQEEKEQVERFPVLEGLRKYAKDHVLLVGRPGSGKSTALVRLLLEEAAPKPQTSEVLKTSEVSFPRVPVLVELRFWQSSILDRILAFFHRHDPQLNLTKSAVKTLLRQGRLLLLIDGLNELPKGAWQDVNCFRNDYEKTTPMIFTTRELSVGGVLGIEKTLEIQPLTEEQMRSFVKAYLPERGDALLSQLKDRLRELGQTPLLLWMLCDLFQYTGTIPSNLGEVFRQFTRTYENKLKQDVPVSVKSRQWWKELLERLAFVMMHEDSRLTSSVEFRVTIGRSEVLQEFEGWLQGRVSDPGDRAAECLEDLLKHHLIQMNGDRLEFCHQMIQEYYAAEYLLPLLPKLTDIQLKCQYLNYLKWTEVIALMLALLQNGDQALRVVKLSLTNVDPMLGAKLVGSTCKNDQILAIDLIINLGLRVINSLNREAWDFNKQKICIVDKRDFSQIEQKEASNGHLRLEDHASPSIFCTLSFSKALRVELLRATRSSAAIQLLIDSVNDENFCISLTAIKALVEIDDIEAIKDLVQSFRDSNTAIIRIIIRYLAESNTAKARQGIDEILANASPQTIKEITGILERVELRNQISTLMDSTNSSIEYLPINENPYDKDLNLFRINDLSPFFEKYEEEDECLFVRYFLKFVDRMSPKAKLEVVEILDKFDDTVIIPVLIQGLDSEDDDICSSTLYLIEKRQSNSFSLNRKLIAFLGIHTDELRSRAAALLGRNGAAETVYSLFENLVAKEVEQYPCIYDVKPILEAIAAIQSRCKFYNYELYQQAQSQVEGGDRSQQASTVHMHFYEKVDVAVGNVEGNLQRSPTRTTEAPVSIDNEEE